MSTIGELVRARAGDARTGLWFEDSSWTWAEVVDARETRMQLVRSHLDTIDLGCLRVVLEEEWAHNSFANRDLDQLTSLAW